MSGELTVAWSGGRLAAAVVSNDRNNVSRRGPACGLRPVCSGSIWYIGLPAMPAATAGTGEGEAAAATAGEGDGPTPAAGDGAPAMGLVAGATEAAGWIAGLVVGAGPLAAGTLVGVGGGDAV